MDHENRISALESSSSEWVPLSVNVLSVFRDKLEVYASTKEHLLKVVYEATYNSNITIRHQVSRDDYSYDFDYSSNYVSYPPDHVAQIPIQYIDSNIHQLSPTSPNFTDDDIEDAYFNIILAIKKDYIGIMLRSHYDYYFDEYVYVPKSTRSSISGTYYMTL